MYCFLTAVFPNRMCVPLRHKFVQVFLEQLSKCKSKGISIYKATYVCCMNLQLFNVYLSTTLELSYSPSDWRPFSSRLQSVAQLITNQPYTSQSTNWFWTDATGTTKLLFSVMFLVSSIEIVISLQCWSVYKTLRATQTITMVKTKSNMDFSHTTIFGAMISTYQSWTA